MTKDVMSNIDNVTNMAGIGHNADDTLDFVQSFKLRREGARPLTFKGIELCSAMSHATGTPLWYEINIYQHVDEHFLVEVKMFSKAENERDHFKVVSLTTLEDVFEFLENYDTAEDIDVPSISLSDKSQPVADLAIKAATLKLRVDEAKRQFNDIVGQILFELETPS